jgi:nicotinamide mononucleotide transporter
MPILEWLQMSSWLELTAMVLAVMYLVLAIMEKRACWYAALASTALYTVIFWDVSLLMESALQIYYMVMAVYGWWYWHNDNASAPVVRWRLSQHLWGILAITMATFVSGWLLSRYTSAVLPYLDAFTTWASVLATVMVARKVLENWLYWIVIDIASIYLYMSRDLNVTAVLFVIYVVLAIVGYRQWMRHQPVITLAP